MMASVRQIVLGMGLAVLGGNGVLTGSEPEAAMSSPRITGHVSPAPSTAASARVELHPLFRTYADAEKLLPGAPPPRPLATAAVRTDGSFALAAPDVGAYRVVLQSEGFLAVEYSLLPLVETTALPAVTLARAEPLTLRLHERGGKPLEGIEVRATCREEPAKPGGGWRRSDRAGRTAANGETVLQRGAAEACDLYLLHPEYLGLAAQGVTSPRLELPLERGRLLQLSVKSLGRGEGAIVSFGSWPMAKIAASGSWQAAAPEPGQSWSLTLQGPQGKWGSGRLGAAKADDRRGSTFSLQQPLVLKGNVVDAATGAPMKHALVWSESPLHAPVRSAADGRFSLETPRLPTFKIGIAAAGYHTLSLVVNSSNGNPAPVQVRLEAKGASGH